MTATDRASAGEPTVSLPRTSGRNPALDGVRVVAAFAVLLTHIGGQTGFEFTGSPASWVVSRGDVGVPIFFALSGVLLYRPWARAALDDRASTATGPYLWRRAVRILPAYWAVVVVALVTLNRGHVYSVSAWVQYLLLVQNYNLHPWWDGTGAAGLQQMWSLVVEVSFYLALPILGALLASFARRAGPDVSRRARRLLAGIAALGLSSYGFAVLAYHPHLRLWLGETLPRLMSWYAVGMAMAVMSEWARAERDPDSAGARYCRTLTASAEACWLIAVLAFVLACTPLAGPQTLALPTLWDIEIKTALYTVIAAGLLAPVAFAPDYRPTWASRALSNGVMSYLGRISYGIFLWQFVVIYAVFRLIHARTVFQGVVYAWWDVLGLFVICGAATVAVASVSYYLLERPAMLLFQTRSTRRPTGRHSRQTEAVGNRRPEAPLALAAHAARPGLRGGIRIVQPDQLRGDPGDDQQAQ
jgi:peptidoglycan/LPS O-acetylase OafA/YrhL